MLNPPTALFKFYSLAYKYNQYNNSCTNNNNVIILINTIILFMFQYILFKKWLKTKNLLETRKKQILQSVEQKVIIY